MDRLNFCFLVCACSCVPAFYSSYPRNCGRARHTVREDVGLWLECVCVCVCVCVSE